MTEETLEDAQRALVQNWEIEAPTGNPDLEMLQRALALKIGEWLDRDPERLVQAMYRLDVAEAKFKAAFQGGSSAEIAEKIAVLVLEREMERAYWRKKYSPPSRD